MIKGRVFMCGVLLVTSACSTRYLEDPSASHAPTALGGEETERVQADSGSSTLPHADSANVASLWREAQRLFWEGEYLAAARVAATAEARGLDPDRARDLRATALLLSQQPAAALRVWEAHQPLRIDGLDVIGPRRIRPLALLRGVGLHEGALLTSSLFVRAHRRLRDAPSLELAEFRLSPSPGGTVHVTLVAVERPTLFRSKLEAAARTGIALVRESTELDWSGVRGGPTRLRGRWRWQEHRREWGLSADGLPLRTPWAVGLRVGWGEETYVVESGRSWPPRVVQGEVALSVGDWVRSSLFLGLSMSAHRWQVGESEESLWGVEPRLELRSSEDRARLRISGGLQGSGVTPRFGSAAMDIGFRRLRPDPTVTWGFSMDAGFQAVSEHTPMALWPGAGTGRARAPLLRAHDLLESGALRTDFALGRTLAHTSLETETPGVWVGSAGLLSAAIFADAAVVGGRVDGLDTFVAWDVGAGVRIRTPLRLTVRLDAALALLDRERAISVGIVRGWDGR